MSDGITDADVLGGGSVIHSRYPSIIDTLPDAWRDMLADVYCGVVRNNTIMRARGLSAVAKLAFFAIWQESIQESRRFAAVPYVEDVADAAGIDLEDAVRGLTELANAGWIRPVGGFFELADTHPFEENSEHGVVYAVEFSDGTVKVGKTQSPNRRLREHASAASRFGIAIVRSWVSIRHSEFCASEKAVLASISAKYPPRSGAEFFAEPCAYDDAVAAAEALLFRFRGPDL